MSAQLDSLIRKSKDLEMQIEQLTAELARLHREVAERMGDRHEYYGHGVVAKKWARVHWEVNKDLLLDELSYEALDYYKEVVLTKTKLDQAVKAGYLPPRLYDRAVKREQLGWNVSLKVLEPQERALERDEEEERCTHGEARVREYPVWEPLTPAFSRRGKALPHDLAPGLSLPD